MEQGADPNYQLYWIDDWCWNKKRLPPVHEACKKGYLKITKALVSDKADIESGDKLLGMTAFHCACQEGHTEIVEYLSQDIKCRIGKCQSRRVF